MEIFCNIFLSSGTTLSIVTNKVSEFLQVPCNTVRGGGGTENKIGRPCVAKVVL